MDLGLSDAVVLVVGGSGYIGREIARQFGAEGARVVITGRDQGRLDAAAARLDGVGVRLLDTANAESVAAAIDSVVDEYGRLDVVVCAAASSARSLDRSEDSDPEQVLHAIDIKAIGYLRLANAVLPVMSAAGRGRLVFVNGQNGLVTGSIRGSARNGAVITISKNLADSTAGTGVTVNTVNPGIVSDEPSRAPQPGKPGSTSPTEVASVVVFLASRVAEGVSGESIAVGHRVHGVIYG
jgi:NAD(P)-dependent dehydrogenase (short-subunit alcohol dehydrogenase family)